ncbi:hypothetical protein [Superficieibacter sp.]|uniref:hypothetical protein n=1 Tax=Superficieibacter sp. TaxID=2303322 RepID=UPI0028B1E2ED|nr:hypothetical protein [Superficieibacter sp.]
MSTFAIIAIPFLVVSVVFLTLAATLRKPVWFILGGVFLASSMVNAVIAMAQ